MKALLPIGFWMLLAVMTGCNEPRTVVTEQNTAVTSQESAEWDEVLKQEVEEGRWSRAWKDAAEREDNEQLERLVPPDRREYWREITEGNHD